MDTKNDKKTGPKRGRGRPRSASSGFRLVPVPHARPDSEKLGRALLSLALHQAEQKREKVGSVVSEVPDERS